MTFLLASTFTDSLTRLTAEEQKLAKTTAFDLQVNPANPGHQLHKLDRARDKNFWSVRVSSDLRLIVHRTNESLMLCYVDHHDKAYAWAERRKLEIHPQTGALQLVEIRETVHEILVPKYIEEEKKPPLLFARCSDHDLLSWGVPPEWLPDVRLATEDSLLELSEHLPSEAAEALLEIAVGGWPTPTPVPEIYQGFAHPDAQRRFRVVSDSAELQQALEASWEKWMTFLHPSQRELVTGNYSGAFRVSGSSGTGKTIVALHRAVYLTRTNPDARVLLVTFSTALANALSDRLRRLISHEPRLSERIEVHSMASLGYRLLSSTRGKDLLLNPEEFTKFLREASERVSGHHFSESFLRTEWEDVVEAWDLGTWDSYQTVLRLGRKARLPEAQRRVVWSLFEGLRELIRATGKMTEGEVFNHLRRQAAERAYPPYDFVVVDEVQDISLPQLRYLASFGAESPNCLFFTGDTAQRILRSPFSWKAAGIDIRGRSQVLKVNYRTSHQIRQRADQLLGRSISDVDGVEEDRSTTISVFSGPAPSLKSFPTQAEEVQAVTAWLRALLEEGCHPQELALIVRSYDEIASVHQVAVELAIPVSILDETKTPVQGRLNVVTMHMAKGLEFRGVAIMGCAAGVIPNSARLENAADASELEEIYNTERHLLYVACTRARDFLLVTSSGEPSEFLEDLQTS